MLFTTFFAFYPDLAWEQWGKVWKIMLMIYVTLMLINTRQKLDWLVWVIVLSLGLYGVKGGIFTILTGGAFRVQGPLGSFISGNNEMGLALIMIIPLMRYLQLQTKNFWIRQWLDSLDASYWHCCHRQPVTGCTGRHGRDGHLSCAEKS